MFIIVWYFIRPLRNGKKLSIIVFNNLLLYYYYTLLPIYIYVFVVSSKCSHFFSINVHLFQLFTFLLFQILQHLYHVHTWRPIDRRSRCLPHRCIHNTIWFVDVIDSLKTHTLFFFLLCSIENGFEISAGFLFRHFHVLYQFTNPR